MQELPSSHYAPEQIVTNDDLAKLWIQVMNGSQVETGIKQRHLSRTESMRFSYKGCWSNC